MSLIKSISGFRGTIGGMPGDNLTPLDIVKFTAAFADWAVRQSSKDRVRIVVGRDARISGQMVRSVILGTLIGKGVDVTDIGLATTPTTEMAVTAEGADGGIIITASHNPMQWNALKLLNRDGEFLSDAEGKEVLALADKAEFQFAEATCLGQVTEKDYTAYHIDKVLALPLVNREAIAKACFKVSVDAVNSVGGIVIPQLLKALGVKEIVELNCTPDGRFAHNPEPLPRHLTEIATVTGANRCNVGFVVDPDVDRLAVICEDGSMFGEEYTLVAASDYVLSRTPGNTVSNLSSSRALRDITEARGGKYSAAAVGEVNVVAEMKAACAVIGGEGNGGVIYPELHYGRDALVGVALILSLMATSGKTPSQLRADYPPYFMSKNRIDLKPGTDVDAILVKMKEVFSKEKVTDIDGVKIDFKQEWVHLRKSNTEPIIRVYTEAHTQQEADALASRVMDIAANLKF